MQQTLIHEGFTSDVDRYFLECATTTIYQDEGIVTQNGIKVQA